MSKTIIEVKCVDQVLTFVNTPVVASGGIGEDYISFEFCEKWNDYTITALFWRQGIDPIPVLADAENLYQVPPELMTSEGVVYFGVAGVDANGVRRTSEAISYRIQAGAIAENTTLPDPDGDVFTQLLAQYADVKLYVASSVTDAINAAINAEKAVEAVQTMLDEGGYIPSNEKGAANGVASLGNDGKVPTGQLPDMDYIPTSEKGATSGVASLGTDGKVPTDQLPDMDYIPTYEKGAASGVATLGTDFKVPSSQLPYLFVSGYYTGNDAESRSFSVGDNVCLLIILGKASHTYYEDFMLIVNPESISSKNTNKGFQMTELHTTNQDWGGASAELQDDTVTLMGGSYRLGFNKTGCTYYYWGLKQL